MPVLKTAPPPHPVRPAAMGRFTGWVVGGFGTGGEALIGQRVPLTKMRSSLMSPASIALNAPERLPHA